MKTHATAVLLVLLGCQQGWDVQEDPAANELSLRNSESALFLDQNPMMHVSAHPDDDLGFMNLSQDLNAGRQLVSLYITAGDAGFGSGPSGTNPPCQSYFARREDGMLRGYEKALGLPVSTWSTDTDSITVTVAAGQTRQIRRRVLAGGQVTLLFMGLPNNPFGSAKQLVNLWDQNVAGGNTLTTVQDSRRTAGIQSYTREQLIVALQAVMTLYQPRHLSTLDSARIWPVDIPTDHPDHVGSSLFALAAKQRYAASAGPTTLRIHRGYNQVAEDDNVSAADIVTRRTIFKAYIPSDYAICAPGQSGSVNVCLGSSPAVIDNRTCDDPVTTYEPFDQVVYTNIPLQGAGGSIRGPGARCLQSSSSAVGGVLSLATCNPALATQKWDLLKSDQLRLRGSNLCASSNVGPPPSGRGTTLSLQTCSASDRNQRFLLTSDTKLRGPDATCVEVASNGTQLNMRECNGNGVQLSWVLQVSSAVSTATATGVSDTEIPASLAYYAALSMGDLNNDNRDDLCERRAGGIYCALASATNPTTFGAFTLWGASFTDAQGWGTAPYGSTVQLAHLNNDHRAEVCGRRSDGVYCATNAGGSFAVYTKRSSGNNFSDTDGYSAADKYLSLRLVDINNDGGADICARNATGIACALNSNPAAAAPVFAASTQWISSEFTDGLGWNVLNGASTLQFADIDGDSRADVCGRGAAGIRCALNNPATSKFDNQHLWSDTDDYSNIEGWAGNESYYRSIRLVDINGDGRADVCGRGFDGVVCGISTGAAFSEQQLLLTLTPYSDGDGWSPAKYGSTLKFADINADGRADLCARGPIPGGGVGIRCAYGPVPAL